MQKLARLSALLCLLIFSGCFDMTEEITVNKNGSGTYKGKIDIRKTVETLRSFMPEDSLKNNKGLDTVGSIWKGIDSIPGITEFKEGKEADYVYTVSFRFANMTALNAALNKNKSDKSKERYKDLFAFSPGSFSRKDSTFDMAESMKGADSENMSDSAKEAMSMIKAFMGDMKVTEIYHFPGKVSSYTNKGAILSPDGKTLTLSVNVMDDDPKARSLSNEVKFKN